MITPLASLSSRLSSALGARLLAGAGTLALLGSIGLMSSRPARTAGGPIPVAVANVPLPTTAADGPAKQPVQVSNTMSQASQITLFYTVPPGKRLVIEAANVFSNSARDANDYTIVLQTGGAFQALNLVQNGTPYAAVSQKMLLYAEAGQPVNVYFQTTNNNASAIIVTFSGHLVDVP